PLSPTPDFSLGQVREGTVRSLEPVEVLEQLLSHRRGEAVTRPRRIDQPIAFVVAEDQRVERLCATGVAADDELLATVDPHLHPRARSPPGLVVAVAALRHESLEALRLD